MKIQKHCMAVAFAAALFLSCIGNAQQQPPQLKMPSDKQVTIFRALRHMPCTSNLSSCKSSMVGTNLEFDVVVREGHNMVKQHHVVDLRQMPKVVSQFKVSAFPSVKVKSWYEFEGKVRPTADQAVLLDKMYDACGHSKIQTNEEYQCSTMQATVLNRLHEYALEPQQTYLHFTEAAKTWRELPQRPPLKEPVRVQRLMAEDALKEGQPYMAIYYYERGLEIDPLWPEGYFNAAMVAASVKMYAQSAEYMEHYLELMPKAQDAESARDQILVWKVKAQEKQ